MEINRREFITGAAATGAAAFSAAKDVDVKSDAHSFSDPAFAGMEGVYTALFTPFKPDLSLNEEMVERLVEFGIANGVRGFYLTGGTGEGLLMSVEERARVYARAAKAANGRAKLIAHVGCVNTDDAVALARLAAKAGCDWVSSVPPVYYGQKPDDVYNHYKLISSATDLPFLIYAANGGNVDPARDVRYFDLPNVKGMKYTGTTFYDVQRLKRRLGKEAIFFSGSDQHMVAAMAFADVFSGSIGTVQNVVPAAFVKIFQLMRANDVLAAAKVQEEVNRVVEFVCHTFPKQSLRKAAMRYIGLDCGQFRHPYEAYTEAEYADFAAKADMIGLLAAARASART